MQSIPENASDLYGSCEPDDVLALLKLRRDQLKQRFEADKSEFTKTASVNPAQAMEWYGSKVMQAQYRYKMWDRFVESVDGQDLFEEHFTFQMDAMKQQIMDEAINSHSQSSSSLFNNAIDDHERAARAECYSDICSMFFFDDDQITINL